MAEYGTFVRGGVAYPLVTGSNLSLLRKADPFIFYALEFFKRVIELHIEPAMLEAAAGTEVQAAVQDCIPLNPLPYLQDTHFHFPLLAVYRVRGTLNEHTVAHRKSEDVFEVVYALPPLTAADAVALGASCKAVRDVLDDRTGVGFDPGHTPTGGTLGQSPWELAGTQKVEFREYSYGFLEGLGELPIWGLTMRGRVQEGDEPDRGDFPDFEGADVQTPITDADGTSADVVEVAVDVTGS